MIFIKKGYSVLNYEKFVIIVRRAYENSPKSYSDLQGAIEAKTPASVQNAFNKEHQKLGDQRLSKILDALEIDAYIIYHKGERVYLVNNNNLN